MINSLAHRHGRFTRQDGKLAYHAFPGTGNFKMVMHAMHGWLPHLQFAQVEPLRDIYRAENAGAHEKPCRQQTAHSPDARASIRSLVAQNDRH